MEVTVLKSKAALGEEAAQKGVEYILKAFKEKGSANIILATGASQFEMLGELVKAGVDWSKVTVFHLDEYIGIPETHPASFRKYLKERFVKLVKPAAFHGIDGEADPEAECKRLGSMIKKHRIDVAFVGIGENGHLAFNDPPADFDTKEPYIVVELDEACRRQQMGLRGDLPPDPVTSRVPSLETAYQGRANHRHRDRLRLPDAGRRERRRLPRGSQ